MNRRSRSRTTLLAAWEWEHGLLKFATNTTNSTSTVTATYQQSRLIQRSVRRSTILGTGEPKGIRERRHRYDTTRIGSTCRRTTIQRLFVCCLDDADDNDDDDDGHCEAYNDTHLETGSALLPCATTRAHLHILPPVSTERETGYWNDETGKLTTYSRSGQRWII